jgi:hypothetical protein
MEAWVEMIVAMMKGFAAEWPDETACRLAYERHNERVRAEVPADRLIDWHPEDGWDPICAALGLDVPNEPFPTTNSTNEFRARMGRAPIATGL